MDIELDEGVVAEAMELTGALTIEALVDRALVALIRLRRQGRAIEDLQGLGWEADLAAMRDGWSLDYK